MDILKKYLERIGVKEFAQLNEEEKDVYRNWQESLNGRKITDAQVAEFILNLENDIIKELIEKKFDSRRDIFLKMQLDLIRKIKSFLMSPEIEKEMTRRGIENLLKQ